RAAHGAQRSKRSYEDPLTPLRSVRGSASSVRGSASSARLSKLRAARTSAERGENTFALTALPPTVIPPPLSVSRQPQAGRNDEPKAAKLRGCCGAGPAGRPVRRLR